MMSLVILLGRVLYQKVVSHAIHQGCIIIVDVLMRVKYGKTKK